MRSVYNILLLSVAFATTVANAQTEGSSFTLTGMGVATPWARDYQCVGINPANLDLDPRYETKVALGLLEGGISLYSAALTKEQVRQNIFQEEVAEFTLEQQRDFAKEFANSANAVDVEITHFGLSIRTERLGTFAFRTRERASFYYELSEQASELLWLGYGSNYWDSLVVSENTIETVIPNSPNLDQATYDKVVRGFTDTVNAQLLSEFLNGTHFKMNWVREFNLSWGKKIWSNEDDIQIHAGLGAKLLIGQGLLAVDVEDGNTQVFSALSPIFQIDYGVSDENPSSLPENAGKLTPVGMGIGFDIGTTLVWKDRIFLSAAVNDIGSMTWDGNVYVLNDSHVIETKNDGIESTDFISQIEGLNGSDAVLDWTGSTSLTTKLPTTFRLGLGMENHPAYKVGIDFIMPLNDGVASMEKPVIAIGGEFSPIKNIHLQAGLVQGGNYDVKIPVGIYFTLGRQGGYEFGIASRDLITFFSRNQPTVSVAFGFLRFRF
ncbi:MAG: DUF5723 family protein [Flavobacteriales bacterium]